jgi:4-amino-4-deoxy-L-arabinose transferase-like glycosyltransferase
MKKQFWTIATSLSLIVVFALGARVIFAWNQERQLPPNLVGLVPFLQETGNIAFSIAKGHGFASPYWQETGPTAWLTPVYPTLVAASFRIFGIHTPRSFFAIVLLNILFSAATCIPIFYIGRRVGGVAVASVAAWLWAVFPNAIIIPYEWVWDTSLSALLMATILWATLELPETKQLRNWCAYGLLWGFTLMTNPSLGVMLPLLLGWAVYRMWKQERSTVPFFLVGPAVVLGIAILCCVPWTIRNYAAFHRFIPLRSNLPFELWLGNNENFDPQSQILPPANPERAEIRNYVRMGETAFMQDKWQKAVTFIETHPRLEVTLSARRFVATWVGMENPVEGFRNADSLLPRIALVSNALAALGGLFGIAVLFLRRSEYTFPIATCPIAFPFLYYVTHASLRYRHPIDPVLMLLASVAISAAFIQRKDSSSDFSPSAPTK